MERIFYCPLCSASVESQFDIHSLMYDIECPSCGDFRLSGETAYEVSQVSFESKLELIRRLEEVRFCIYPTLTCEQGVCRVE